MHFFDHLLSWLYTYRLWGPRCPDREDDCPLCKAWKIHDDIFND